MSVTVPQRWWFVGVSGSGKTTYAKQVAARLGVTHLELDSVYHQAQWTPLDDESFRSRVREVAHSPGWTMDGNYRVACPEIIDRVQVIVAVDLPKKLVMRQVITRTVTRSVRDEELWNGNKEKWSNMLRWDPQKSIIRWAWTTYDITRQRVNWFEREANEKDIVFLRASSHREVQRLIDEQLARA